MNHDEEREPQTAANEQALEAELALELGPPEVPPAEAAPTAGLPTDARSAEAGPNDLGAGDLGAGELLDDESLLRALTALVYASPDPLTERRLQQLLERPALPRVRTALQALGERLTATGLPLELRQIAGGWQILTVADLGSVVQRLEKARKIGAKSSQIADARLELCRDFAFPVMQWQAKYEGLYLLGTSIARPLISKVCLQVARDLGATVYAHGATGKGNDQCRFQLAAEALNPSVRILAP